MSAPSTLDAQIGFAEESTYGTGVTVTRFYELVEESMSMTVERVESKGIRTGTRTQRSDRWRPGKKVVGGGLTFEVLNKSFGFLFKHCFGSVNTTGPVSTLYTHTFTPGDLTGDILTGQIGRPDVSGTVQPFTYEGIKIKSWELSAKVDEALMLKLDTVAEDERSPVTSPAGAALASASFPSSAAMLVFVDGSVTVAGSAMPIKEFSLKCDNGLKSDRFFLGSQVTSQPLEQTKRNITIELTPEFVDTTAYGRYVNGTEAAVVLTFAVTIAAVTFSLVITMNVRFDGNTPQVKGEELLDQPLIGKCCDTGAGASTAITAVYVTTDSAP